jgi:hypothetical protein
MQRWWLQRKRPPVLFRGECVDCRAAPNQKADAVGLGVFFVHRSCRDATGVAWAEGAAIIAKDKGDQAAQHKQSRIKPMSMRFAMLVWLDFALPKLIALALKMGFKLCSVHGHYRFFKIDGNLYGCGVTWLMDRRGGTWPGPAGSSPAWRWRSRPA